MWKHGLCGLTVVALVAALWMSVQADDPPKSKVEMPQPKKLGETARTTMRKKLAAAQDVLEGLTTEDFEIIERGAKLLGSLSKHADFQISKDMMYIQHADEFQALAAKLEKAAKAKSLDKVTLHYMDLTMNCIECHRFVRNVLVAGAPSR